MWKNEIKFRGVEFKSGYVDAYEVDDNGNDLNTRTFTLVGILKNGKSKYLSYESWQAAAKDGWVKIK